ncbi:hypothetical protein DXG01_012041 [Tephrocybe rancida]|nr:hypothetical protein DXG01_012041 [Tephrocybe rancida]
MEYTLPRNLDGDSISIAAFASETWLGSTHMNQMSGVINAKLCAQQLNTIQSLSDDFMAKLVATFRHSKDIYLTDKSCQFMRSLGNDFHTGNITTLSIFVSVHISMSSYVTLPSEDVQGNHWAAVLVDKQREEILYGDLLGFAAPQELLNAIEWWLGMAMGCAPGYTVKGLPCTCQNDGFLCSMFSVNAIKAWFFALEIDLVENSEDVLCHRAEMIEKIVSLIHTQDLHVVVSSSGHATNGPQLSTGFVPVTSSFTPQSVQQMKRPLIKDAPTPTNAKRSKETHTIIKTEPKPSKVDIPIYSLFMPHSKLDAHVSQFKTIEDKDKVVQNEHFMDLGYDYYVDDETAQDDEEETYESPSDLINIEEPQKKKTKNGKNIPRKLSTVALGMNVEQSGSIETVSARIAITGTAPTYLQNFVGKAAEAAAKKAAAEAHPPAVPAAGAKKQGGLLDFTVVKEANGRKVEEQNSAINLAMVQLFCAAGLPTFLAARPEFINALHKLNPKYPPPSWDRLEDDLIPSEAAKVQLLMYNELKEKENLMISMDGDTTRGSRQAFWTMHISTDDQKVYFVEAKEATRESHTGEWIKMWVLKVKQICFRSKFGL